MLLKCLHLFIPQYLVKTVTYIVARDIYCKCGIKHAVFFLSVLVYRGSRYSTSR